MEIYGKAYQEEYQRRERSEVGRKIYEARWAMVERHAAGHRTLLDYGCANGGFHLSTRNGFAAAGFDVNPYSPFNKPYDPLKVYDILTFWDSLEHIPDFKDVILCHDPTWIFLSTPNLESVKGPVKDWKHYKPHEHIYYFDQYSLTTIFDALDYKIIETNFEEGALRDPLCPEAIISVALRKR